MQKNNMNPEIIADLLSSQGYVPTANALARALRPGYLVEWVSDMTGARYFAIVSGVTAMGGGRSRSRDTLIMIISSRKQVIMPDQVVAVHAILPS